MNTTIPKLNAELNEEVWNQTTPKRRWRKRRSVWFFFFYFSFFFVEAPKFSNYLVLFFEYSLKERELVCVGTKQQKFPVKQSGFGVKSGGRGSILKIPGSRVREREKRRAFILFPFFLSDPKHCNNTPASADQGEAGRRLKMHNFFFASFSISLSLLVLVPSVIPEYNMDNRNKCTSFFALN